MNPNQYFLAIDGGGTKTHVLCVDSTGQVVGEGISGPTSLTVSSIGAANFNLREAVRQATEQLKDFQIQKAAMGLAGMDTQKEYDLAYDTFSKVFLDYSTKEFVLYNDIVISLEGGTDNPNALAIIAGHGSNCYGRNQAGQSAKTSGMDYLLTDQGSGYEIGRYVLRTAVKSFDGRIPKSRIEELVCDHFKIQSIQDLKDEVYNPILSKTEVASLANVCAAAFNEGDKIAIEIYDHAIDELYLMAATVISRLGLEQTQVDCVLSGKILKIDYIKQSLTQKLTAAFPQINVVSPELDRVHGAVKIALRK